MNKKILLTLLSTFVIFISCKSVEKKQNKQIDSTLQPMELTTFDTIHLLQPDTTEGKPLMYALQHRKSDREFQQKNLSLKHLSEILWAAYGVNRPNGKRTVPSAMALYPLQVYAVLSNGIYFYEPHHHTLMPTVKGDYRSLAGLQDFVYTAPLNLIFIADYHKYNTDRKIPDENRIRLVSLDAAHSTQNVYLYCASEGLKCVVRAGAKEKELLDVLKLDPNYYQFIVAQTVGY